MSEAWEAFHTGAGGRSVLSLEDMAAISINCPSSESSICRPSVFGLRPSPFNPDVFEGLLDSCDDTVDVGFLCRGFREGFDIGFVDRMENDGGREYSNRSLSGEESVQLDLNISKELEKGHIAKSHTNPFPMSSLVSPIGAVPKTECTIPTGKFRTIFNLSKTVKGGRSVNDCISENMSSVKYQNFDDAVEPGLALDVKCRRSTSRTHSRLLPTHPPGA